MGENSFYGGDVVVHVADLRVKLESGNLHADESFYSYLSGQRCIKVCPTILADHL